jgi:MSHA biogenesis protein MshL
MFFKKLLHLSIFIVICSCQSPKKTTAVAHSLDSAIAEYESSSKQQVQPSPGEPLLTIPDEINQALLPGPSDNLNPLFGESKYDINAQKLEASAFFSSVVKGTPYSVAIHPEVTGEISLDLKQVTLADVFDLVAEIYGYDIERNKNIYRIYPAGMRTETFAVNYLLMTRDGSTQTSITSGGVSQESGSNSSGNNSQNGFSGNSSSSGNNSTFGSSNNSNGTNISTRTETDFWTELLAT